jgi:hypothetical protein
VFSSGKGDNSRYEMKYIISDAKASAVRDFIRPYLEADEYAAGRNPPGYFVHSLYLDSPHMSLYQQTVNGEKNRYKLRMRFYDEEPDSPVFLEVKRRTTDTISKTRAAVSRTSAEDFLNGKRLYFNDLLKQDDKSKLGLTQFCELCDRVQAKGSIFVSYRREAYIHPTIAGLRVTFDRDLVGCAYRKEDGLKLPGESHRAPIPGVILELKYIGRFPSWMGRLAQTFDLRRQSVPKYVECFDVMPAAISKLGAQLAS